jgi:hypothetical protein
MNVLRRALLAFAAVWSACGLALLLAPTWVLVDLFHQDPYPDYAYVRVAGVSSLVLALFAVMVSRRDDAWWWAWGFVVAAAATGTIAILRAVLDPVAGGEALWWLFATTSAALTVWLVVGLTRASQDHPLS